MGLTLRQLGVASLRDLTLRHLQRALRAAARGEPQPHDVQVCAWGNLGEPMRIRAQMAGCCAQATVPATMGWWDPWMERAARNLDRAVGILGPGYRPFAVPAEARPKGTAEVDGSSQQGDQAHGGDSASGEVPDGESGGGAPRERGEADGLSGAGAETPRGGTTAEPGDRGTPETGPQATSGQGRGDPESPAGPAEARTPDGAPDASSAQPADPDPGANGSGVAGVVSGACGQPESEGRTDGGIPGAPDLIPADGDGASARQPDAEPILGGSEDGAQDGGASTPDRGQLPSAGRGAPHHAARRAHGGVHAALPPRADRPLFQEVRQVLQRLIGDAVEDDGPRLDQRASVARLLARRSNWVVRREEEGRPAILCLVDVSGSCSSFCRESVSVARAVAQQGLAGADVVVVVHSNGYPAQALVNASRVPVPDTGDAGLLRAWYADLVSTRDIRHVILLGDGDGEWLYRDLAHRPSVEHILWLDGYRARIYGAPRRKARPTPEMTAWLTGAGWSNAAQRKIAYVDGCGSAAQFAAALRVAIG